MVGPCKFKFPDSKAGSSTYVQHDNVSMMAMMKEMINNEEADFDGVDDIGGDDNDDNDDVVVKIRHHLAHLSISYQRAQLYDARRRVRSLLGSSTNWCAKMK